MGMSDTPEDVWPRAITYKASVDVDKQFCQDVLSTFIESSLREWSWFRASDWERDANGEYEWADLQQMNVDDDGYHDLGRIAPVTVLRGLRNMVERPEDTTAHRRAVAWLKELDAGDVDAGDADAIIQYAVLGEEVYG